MKRCPACSRTYPDDQNFCFDDGTTLVASPTGPPDSSDAPTANYPYRSSAAPTEILHATPTEGMGRPVVTAPPPAFVSPYAQPKRSPLLWIVGGVVALAIAVGVVIFLASRTETASTTQLANASWQTVEESGFSISMPGAPAKTEQTTPSPAGPLPIHMYTLTHGYEEYVTGYTQYPDYVFTGSEPEVLLDRVQQGAVANVGGQVTSQRAITLDGNPGREIIGKSPEKNTGFTARIYIVKPRLYMLVYSQYDKDKPISDHGKQFLDSFQIKAGGQSQNANQSKP